MAESKVSMPSVERSSQITPQSSKRGNSCKTLIAIALVISTFVLILLGAVNDKWPILAAGACLLVVTIILACYKKKKEAVFKSDNIEAYKDTEQCIKQGYYVVNGQQISLAIPCFSMNASDRNQVFSEELPHLKSHRQYPTYDTRFYVRNADTFDLMCELSNREITAGLNDLKAGSGDNGLIAGLNMANKDHAGGGAASPHCNAQEEQCARRSTLTHELLSTSNQDPSTYQVPEKGSIYTPNIVIFKDRNYSYMQRPVRTAMISVAAYDLRENSTDRRHLGIDPTIPLPDDRLWNHAAYFDGTRAKIRNMLRALYIQGHRFIVLGALGCGAFRNDPHLISQIFFEEFNSEEFRGKFIEVYFAILDDGSSRNFQIFSNRFKAN